MNLESIILSEIIQTEKDKYPMLSFRCANIVCFNIRISYCAAKLPQTSGKLGTPSLFIFIVCKYLFLYEITH